MWLRGKEWDGREAWLRWARGVAEGVGIVVGGGKFKGTGVCAGKSGSKMEAEKKWEMNGR